MESHPIHPSFKPHPGWSAGTLGLTLVAVLAMGAVRFESLLWVGLSEGALVFCWLIAAAGWGWAWMDRCLPKSDPVYVWIAGAATQLLLAWVLGWIGWLDGLSAWALAGATSHSSEIAPTSSDLSLFAAEAAV